MVLAHEGDEELVVGDGGEGNALLTQPTKETHEFNEGSTVLTERGFVHDDDAGRAHQCGCYRQPALLATRQLERVRLSEMFKAQHMKQFIDAFQVCGGGCATLAEPTPTPATCAVAQRGTDEQFLPNSAR